MVIIDIGKRHMLNIKADTVTEDNKNDKGHYKSKDKKKSHSHYFLNLFSCYRKNPFKMFFHVKFHINCHAELVSASLSSGQSAESDKTLKQVQGDKLKPPL